MEQIVIQKSPAIGSHWFALIVGFILTCAVPLTPIRLFILLCLFLKKLSAKYIVTSEKCICEYGLISKKHSEVYLDDIRGVSFQQGIMQRILCVGDVHIGSAATAGAEVVFRNISSPSFVVDQINNCRRKNH